MSPPPILALKGVGLRDGPGWLLREADLAIEPKARVCLVGRNGAGKSTLLRILTDEILPDEGERTLNPGARIVRVDQEPVIRGDSLADWASSGGAARHKAETQLESFGLDPARPTKGLSGGEVRRAALARAFAEDPDVLLLDEPTNHLDILAIERLERKIAACRAAVLMVSHDRAFLQRVTRTCFWLEGRRVRRLDKGFVAFPDWSESILNAEAEVGRRLDKAIERESEWMGRSITARRTRNEGRARELVKLREERAQVLAGQPRQAQLGAGEGALSGKIVIELRKVAKRFGERDIFRDLSTRVLRGDRIAIVGPNGAGKTTLVKIMLGELEPDEGTVRLGKGLQPAYLDQAREALKPGTMLVDALSDTGSDFIMVRGQPRHVAGYAKDFLFADKQLRQPVDSLSGGERNRLLLAKILARPANLLVLDEPTNDLDMDTLDLLEDVLADYEGTLILVSHDRDFIERLAASTIALDGHGRVVETPGGWTDFESQNPGFFLPSPLAGEGGPRRGSGEGSRGHRGSTPHPAVSRPPSPARASPRAGRASGASRGGEGKKLSFKDAHRLKALDALMPRLTAEIAAHEKTLSDSGLYGRDPAGFQRTTKALQEARATLAAAEDEWLALEEKREALNA
jgi:ATP-binding cassette subfamily F protein uup